MLHQVYPLGFDCFDTVPRHKNRSAVPHANSTALIEVWRETRKHRRTFHYGEQMRALQQVTSAVIALINGEDMLASWMSRSKMKMNRLTRFVVVAVVSANKAMVIVRQIGEE